jgi:hypothetical protein
LHEHSVAALTHAVSDEKTRTWRRRKRRLRRRLRRLLDVALVLVVIVVVATAVMRRGPKSSGTTTTSIVLDVPRMFDVKLGPCRYGNYAASAPVTITNHSPIRLNYVVEVTFNDGNAFFALAIATYDHLRPKGTVRLVASGVSTLGTPAHLTCKVTRISRFTG